MATNKVENKVEELKEELKEDNTDVVVVESESKVRKIVTTVLKGVALVATGFVGFLLGRHIGNDSSNEDSNEENTEE